MIKKVARANKIIHNKFLKNELTLSNRTGTTIFAISQSAFEYVRLGHIAFTQRKNTSVPSDGAYSQIKRLFKI